LNETMEFVEDVFWMSVGGAGVGLSLAVVGYWCSGWWVPELLSSIGILYAVCFYCFAGDEYDKI
jgi:hypothetical protein